MEDNLKKILDRLERMDHKEYKTAFEFADSATFKEMARCFKERMIMADYITNLQEENKRLLKIKKYAEEVGEKRNELYERIDKAIEYIKENADYGIQEKCCMNDLNYDECDILLNILQGGD